MLGSNEQKSPPLLHLRAGNIPDELRALPRWAPWRVQYNERRGKWDKIPCDPRKPQWGLSSAKPERWATFDVALATHQANPDTTHGIGLCLTDLHGWVALDLDRCTDANGTPEAWAHAVASRAAALGAHIERSPSGRGLRIMLPGDMTGDDWTNHTQGLEVYRGSAPRFVTMTGNTLEVVPSGPQGDTAGAFLADLRNEYAQRPKPKPADAPTPEVEDTEATEPVNWETLDLPSYAEDFLRDGVTEGDRSTRLQAVARALVEGGLTGPQVLATLADNPHAWAVALSHRHDDPDRAREYLWRWHVAPAVAHAAANAPLAGLPDLSGTEDAPKPEGPGDGGFVTWDLDANPPPPRRYVIDGILPRGQLSGLWGAGAAGKSLLCQQLGTCVAAGIDAFGLKVEQGPVLIWAAEDDTQEIRRRQVDVSRTLGHPPPPDLHVRSRVGKDNTLMAFDPKGRSAMSEAWTLLEADCERMRPALVVLDNISHIFGGNENDRGQVIKFANRLAGLAMDHDCAVLMLGHPAKAEGSEFSGSTAWETGVRGRLHLKRDRDTNLTTLSLPKTNRADAPPLALRWRDGAFIKDPGTDAAYEEAYPRMRAQILRAVDQARQAKECVSHSSNAREGAYIIKRMAVSRSETPEYARCLAQLLLEGALLPKQVVGRNSHRGVQRSLVVAPGVQIPADPDHRPPVDPCEFV